MSLDAKVLGLDQKVDFSDGSLSNVIRVALPSGAIIVALVTEEGAAQVLAEVQIAKNVFKTAQAAHQPPLVTPVVFSQAPPQAPRQPAFEFGGDGVVDEVPEEEDEAVVGPQLGPSLTRMRQPAVNDAGAPVDATGRPLYESAPEAPEERQVDEDGVPGL